MHSTLYNTQASHSLVPPTPGGNENQKLTTGERTVWTLDFNLTVIINYPLNLESYHCQ
jgi:hypothetical protein